MFVEKRVEIKVGINDQDDIILLSYALNAEAKVFVTGDRELLNLKKVKDLKIVSPREY
ncbi:hypothetical protein GWN28_19780 [candidate division KSB1 bacterium]|nr:hypothetical protein [candidate division KSB1 bacterium]NIW20553.1 hypothetical protein [candidate division KSB1 bacterium]NIW71016.1 hypothetical protein [candidate division KSB1 bacterium]